MALQLYKCCRERLRALTQHSPTRNVLIESGTPHRTQTRAKPVHRLDEVFRPDQGDILKDAFEVQELTLYVRRFALPTSQAAMERQMGVRQSAWSAESVFVPKTSSEPNLMLAVAPPYSLVGRGPCPSHTFVILRRRERRYQLWREYACWG